MSELWVAVHIEGEGKEFEAKVEKLEERIDDSGIGEAVGHTAALGEIMIIVELPPLCTEADLPGRMRALREILVGEGLDGLVEIPKDADDDEEDEDEDEEDEDEEA